MMKTNFIKSLLTVLVMVSFTQIFSQEIRKISLQEAIDLADKNNYLLQGLANKKDAAKAKYDQQKFSTIPALTLNSSYLYNSPNIAEATFPGAPGAPAQIISMTLHNQNQNRLSLSQVVFSGLRGWNTIHAAKNLWQAAELDAQKEKMDLKSNTTQAYFNHLKLKESLKIVTENLQVLQSRKEDMTHLQQVGMALKNDLLKIELAQLNLEQNKVEILTALEVSNFNLCMALGMPENTLIECAEEGMFAPKSLSEKASVFAESLNHRNDMKALNARINASNYMVKASKSGYFPMLSAGGNFYYSNPNQRVFIVSEANKGKYYNTWDIGLTLSWNLTNLFTTTFQTREAKANLQQLENTQKQLTDAIKMEVNANYANYKLALNKIELAKKTLDKTKEDQRITKNQYDNGLKNMTDLLEADNGIATAQINLTNAKIDAEIAFSKLTKSTGN